MENLFNDCRDQGLHILETLTQTKTDQGTRFEGRTISPSFLASSACLVFLTSWKGGFIFGGDHGSGFAIAHNRQHDGFASWSAPCFVKFDRLEFGCVCGLERVDTIMAAITQRAANHLCEGSRQVVGVDVTVQIWPLLPAGGPDDETNLDIMGAGGPDWVVASVGQGILLDLSISGGSLRVDNRKNQKMYGEDIKASDILEGKISRPVELQPLYRKLNEMCIQALK